ncbi:phage tail protein [Clostridium sp. Marseille-QA1073]
MAEQFYSILTSIGKAKIANANTFGNKLNLTTLVLGDGNGKYYNPTENQEAIVNEVWKGNVSSITTDSKNPNWIVIETIIAGNIGGFFIREVGIFDDEGSLIAIGKYPETYKPVISDGSTKDLIIRMILEVSNSANVTLKVDPAIIMATKKDVEVLENKIKDLKGVYAEDLLDETIIIEGEMHPLIKDEFEKVETKINENKENLESQMADIVNNTNYINNSLNNFSKYIGNNYTTVYVNYENGDDNNDGLSSKAPFKTVDIISKYYKTVEIYIEGDYPNNIIISNMNAIIIRSKNKCKGIIIENCKHVKLYLSSIDYLQCYNCDVVYTNGYSGGIDVTSYIDVLPGPDHNGGHVIKHSLSFYNCSVFLHYMNFKNLETDYFIGASQSLIRAHKCTSDSNSNKSAYYCEDSKIYEWDSNLVGKTSKAYKTTMLYGNEV